MNLTKVTIPQDTDFEAAKAWLRENPGKDEAMWWVTTEDELTVFLFEDKNQALLFKLALNA